MIKLKILYLYLIWIEGFPPKRKVVARLLSGMSFFLSFNRIFNGFWRVNDKRDLSDVFIIQISFCYAFGFSRLSTKYETTKPPAMRVVSKKCYTK